jgi:hypothetical protein
MSLDTMTALFNFYISEYHRLVVEAAQHRRSGHHGNSYLALLYLLDRYFRLIYLFFFNR